MPRTRIEDLTIEDARSSKPAAEAWSTPSDAVDRTQPVDADTVCQGLAELARMMPHCSSGGEQGTESDEQSMSDGACMDC